MSQKERTLKMMTTNRNKFLEAKAILAGFNINLTQVEEERVEIQADDLEEIARFSAETAAHLIGVPLIVEDAGLFIQRLNGFPGPYSSYTLRKIGLDGILKIMEGVQDRGACFKSVVAFCSAPQNHAVVFIGVVTGTISLEKRGEGGFGYDPLFIPLEGDGRTFAEMSPLEKGGLSHRGRALREFGGWFTQTG